MKKNFGLILLAFLIPALLNGQRTVKKVSESVKKNEIKIISQSSTEMVVEVDLNEVFSTELTVNGKETEIFSLQGGSPILEKGAPDLGKLSVSYEIPNARKMAFEVLETEYKDYEGVEVAPSKGNLTRDQDPSKVPFIYGDVYKKDGFYPQKLVQLNTPYILNEKRGQSVWFYPLQYNPVQKVLRVYSKMKVRYYQTTEKGQNELVKVEANNSSEIFNNIYKGHFANYKALKYNALSETGKMLIVCYDDFANEMAGFVEWKKQRGLEVELVKYSQVGSSSNDIKNYVEDYYTKKGLTFLLLVGDAQQIPSLRKSGDSDAAYGHIKGNDSYAEVIVGRFSAENAAQVKTQVERTIYYERDIATGDTWLGKGMGLASNEGGPGQGDDDESDKQHMDNIRKDLLNFGYSTVDQVYDPGASASTVASNLNSGRGVVNYVGHGSNTSFSTTGFNIADVNDLKNENKLPFIFDVACVNGNFHGRTCFAESWLRATNNGKPTGAVAIIASTINQSWAPPMDAQDEMNDLLVHSVSNNTKRTFGGVTVNGIMHMIDEYGSQGSKMSDTWTIFGDPSLILRNKSPKEMEISYNNTLPAGSTSMDVSCNSEGAYVCLSRNGEIVGKSIVSGGKATLRYDAVSGSDPLKLTVVGQDKVTHQGDITIGDAGSVVAVNGYDIVKDDNSNGQVDFGESFSFSVELINEGDKTAENVKASVTISDDYVVSSENKTLTFGNISSNGTKSSNETVSVQVANNVPDGYELQFKLVITGDNIQGEIKKSVFMKVNAPNILFGDLSVDDNFEGNTANGIIEPGEKVKLNIKVENNGHADVVDAEASLEAFEEKYFVFDPVLKIEGLAVGKETTLTYTLTASDDIPAGYTAKFTNKVKFAGYTFEKETSVLCNKASEINMYNGEISVNSAMFYDDGGKTGNYSLNDYTLTMLPGIDGKQVQVTFIDLELYSHWWFGSDYIYIYNSKTVDENALIGRYTGRYHANVGDNGVVTGTNPDGALTFVFNPTETSRDGWEAEVALVDAPRAEKEITSVELAEGESEMKVYPNPVKDVLTLVNVSDSKIKLIDMTGATVKSIVTQENTEFIDVSDIANGSYIVLISSENAVTTHRIVVAK